MSAMLWTCKCGFKNWLHHERCYQCFEPRPEDGKKNGVVISDQTKANTSSDKTDPGNYGMYTYG